MKSIMKNCMVFFLSFSLAQTVMPMHVYAMENVRKESPAKEINGRIITETAGEGNLLFQISEEPVTEKEAEPEDLNDTAHVEASGTFDDPGILHLNQAQTVNILTSGASPVYSFMPTASGYYRITSEGSYDPKVSLYADENTRLGADSNSYDGRNFCLTYELSAGTTYYYQMSMVSESARGSFDVLISKDNMLTIVPVGGSERRVKPGSDVNLEIKVLGADLAGMSIVWEKGNTRLAQNTQTCMVSNLTRSAKVSVSVTDRYGNTESRSFDLIADNGLSGGKGEEVYLKKGEKYTMRPEISADDMSGIEYEWLKGYPNAQGVYRLSEVYGEDGPSLTSEELSRDTVYVQYVYDTYGNRAENIWTFHVSDPDACVIEESRLMVAVGKTKTVSVSSPNGASFLVGDSELAQVDEDGVITGLKVGKTYIFAHDRQQSGKSDTKPLSVLFSDTANPNSYYFEPVYWAADHNITTGVSAERFAPNENCTREQIVTFLWRAAGSPAAKSHVNFNDVKPSAWYYEAVSWAFENGITTGVDAKNFGVGMACTREMAVTFIYRLSKLQYYSNVRNGYKMFTDVKDGKYYFDAISWAYDRDITTGLNDGTGNFGIGTSCSRAMIVAFLYRWNQSRDINDEL